MNQVLCTSYVAGEDLSSAQFRFVYLSSANTVTLIDSGTPLGVLQNDPESGEIANVMVIGISRLTMSASSTIMARIGTTTDGKGVAVTADQAIYGAIGLEASSGDGAQINVLLTPAGMISTT